MNIESYMKVIGYKVGDSTKYCWNCFGKYARYMDYDADMDTPNVSCVFDTKSQEVYMVEMYDHNTDVMYKWFNLEYVEAYNQEFVERGCDDFETNIKNVILTEESDILEKIYYAVLGQEYDKRVKIPIDLPDDEMFQLMKLAHEKDITLNQLIGNVIQQSIEKYETTDE
jgi:hypothetical protein